MMDNNKLRVALVSLNQAWEDKLANFSCCQKVAAQAKEQGADIVIFPEMTLTGFSMNTIKISENRADSTTTQQFQELAMEIGIGIVFGVVYQQSEQKASNNLIYISDTGKIKASYTKIHPFTFADEDQFYISGTEVSSAKIGPFNSGFTICYDLRFPELYSGLAQSCSLIINIANWPKRRVEHWKTLLRARAIENQIYMIGVNRTGFDGNELEFEKSSCVIDANGQELKAIYSSEELDIFDINAKIRDDFKQQFSTFHDRKPELYRTLI